MSALLHVPLLDTLSSAPRSAPENGQLSGGGGGEAGEGGSRGDVSRPSVFELLAQDELRGMIQPAFRYVLAWLANHRPRYFLRLVHRHEEVYAALLTFVEWWHLTNHGASFSEHFYGLRVSPLPLPTSTSSSQSMRTPHLTKLQKWGYIGCLVGIPYLRLKLTDLHSTIRNEHGARLADEAERGGYDGGNGRSRAPSRSRSFTDGLRKAFVTVYPYLNLLYEASLVGYDLRYMFDPDRLDAAWRPWLKLLSLEIIRKPSALPSPSSPTGSFSSSARSRSPLLRALHRILLTTTTNLLPFTLLTLKALQWWYSPQSPRLMSVVKRDRMRVPPPEMIKPGTEGRSALNLVKIGGAEEREMEILGEKGERDTEDGEGTDSSDEEEDVVRTPQRAPSNSGLPDQSSANEEAKRGYKTLPYGICPICRTEWKNPTVTPTGYVGCYLCLYHDVDRSGTCPVTGVAMRTEDLRKVLV